MATFFSLSFPPHSLLSFPSLLYSHFPPFTHSLTPSLLHPPSLPPSPLPPFPPHSSLTFPSLPYILALFLTPSLFLSSFFPSSLSSPLPPSSPHPYTHTCGAAVKCTSRYDNSHHCHKTTNPVLLNEVSDEATSEFSPL